MQKNSLEAWLAGVGGVAHSVTVRAAGYSDRAMAAAVAAGQVERIRRSWLALRSVDPRLRAAVAAGGRLTCVSSAARKGLWVPNAALGTHIALKPTASRAAGDDLVRHWAQGPVAVTPHAPDDHVLNVLFHVARCQPRREAFAVWESAVRKGLVTAGSLPRVKWCSTQARDLAQATAALSDSGTESMFVLGMRDLGVMVRQQVWIDGHPLDGVIGDRLLVQIDGFEHHSSARDRRRDLRADARLALLGYTVLRFDWYQVLFDWPYVVDTVLTAMAQGLHLPTDARRA